MSPQGCYSEIKNTSLGITVLHDKVAEQGCAIGSVHEALENNRPTFASLQTSLVSPDACRTSVESLSKDLDAQGVTITVSTATAQEAESHEMVPKDLSNKESDSEDQRHRIQMATNVSCVFRKSHGRMIGNLTRRKAASAERIVTLKTRRARLTEQLAHLRVMGLSLRPGSMGLTSPFGTEIQLENLK